MAASRALWASGLLGPSFRVPSVQAHTARSAKFIFRTILCPAEGTKHEAFYTPLSGRFGTRRL